MGQKTTLTVFIVDDSAIVRDRFEAIIAELDRVSLVGQASRGPGALEAIRDLEPDVVILDIRMPQGNGIEILKEMKANENSPRVIMLTAYPYPQYRQKCLAAGADHFFDKATEFDRVAEVLQQEALKLQTNNAKTL